VRQQSMNVKTLFIAAGYFWTRKAGPKKPLCDLLLVVVISSPGSKNP